MQKRSIKEVAMLSSSLMAALIISPFSYLRFLNTDYIIASLDVVIVLVLLSIFIYVWRTRKTKTPGRFLSVFSLAMLIIIVHYKGADVLYWIYPVLLSAFYVFNTRNAILFSLTGFICLLFLLFNSFDVIQLMSFVATYCITCLFSAVFLRTIRLHNNRATKNHRINSYRNKILELISTAAPLNQILKTITEAAEQEFNEIRCSILLLDEKTQTLSAGSVGSFPDFYNEAIKDLKIGRDVGCCGASAYTGERIIVEDIATHPHWKNWSELAKKANFAACWSEPIKNSTNDVLGTFAIYLEQSKSPTEEQLKLIVIFAHMAGIAIERETNNQVIWQQANFDQLTSLPNRHMMLEFMSAAMRDCERNKYKLAVVFLDLDNFKDVNDSLGHDIGDLLLIEAAARIKRSIRSNDTVARLGGDEFIVMLTELHSSDGTNRIVENLLHNLALPYHLKDKVVHSSASIGVTVFPDDATDINALLRNADQAMYGAKALGRNNFHHFTKTMHESALARMALNNDLRKAIANDEFQLVYQPIVNLNNGEINKAEALIRWHHPERGLVSPLDFIPIAEETGLIIDISNWIFKEAARQSKRWRKCVNPNLQISINTSPRQYNKNDGNIMQWLKWFDEHNIDRKSIALEITENLLMESHEQLEVILNEVKRQDIELSIDDFGTGYSSFSYLREFQTHYLKIDKSFVQKMSEGSNDIALCEAIIGMAKKLKIKVIAEGIETAEQQMLLENMHCDYGQGYYFSKPLPATEFEQLISENMNVSTLISSLNE